MSENFIKPFEKEKYDDYIKRILSLRDNIKIDNVYMERHHIVPKCIGGNNNDENLIYLFPEEHYYAHKLLALENPDSQSLSAAWWMMSHINNNYIDEEEYNLSRINRIKILQITMSGENNPMYGKKGELCPSYGITRSDETKEKISKSKLNKPLSEEHKKAISNGSIHRSLSEEEKNNLMESWWLWYENGGKEILSKNMSGEKNPMYGKHHTKEWKEYMSKNFSGENAPNYGKHFSEETRKKISEAAKNRVVKPVICINTGEVFKTTKEAGISKNISPSNITCALKGKQKSAGKDSDGNKIYWMYYEDYLNNNIKENTNGQSTI